MIQKVKYKQKMKRKKADGTPIYKEVDRYRFKVYYTDSLGSRKQKCSKLFESQRAAQEAEAEFLANHKNKSDSSNITFDILYDMYVTDVKSRVQESSLITFESYVENHIIPFFKGMKINSITPAVIRQWQVEMLNKTHSKSNKKYSSRTLKTSYMRLASILEYGVKYYGLSQNPAKIQGNFRTNSEIIDIKENFYTYDEFNRFIEHIDESYQILFIFLYFTGCRIGEALALNWNDYDGSSIKVTKSITTLTNEKGCKITPPKTKSSIRTIDLPKNVIFELNSLKEYQKSFDGFEENWFIFGGSRYLSRSTLTRSAYRAMDEAGLKRITIHGFRHSHASLLINGNMNIKLISERLGHANVSETLNTYTHMFPDQRNICVNYLNEIADS